MRMLAGRSGMDSWLGGGSGEREISENADKADAAPDPQDE
jgi:hypothetical protein